MLNLEKKWHNLQVGSDRFMAKLQILISKGLPYPMVISDKLMTQSDYIDKIREIVQGIGKHFRSQSIANRESIIRYFRKSILPKT